MGDKDWMFAWLERLPTGEIYERLTPWVRSIPFNLGEIRDRSLYLLSMWYEHYFRHLPQALLARLEQDAALTAGLAQRQQPRGLIEQLTNGMCLEPVAELGQVLLIPQYHCSPFTVLDFYHGMATCLYPVRQRQDIDPVADLLPLTQCLADERGVMLMTVHGQISVPLSQYLQQHFVDGVKLFGVLMSVNGLTVLLIQVWLIRWSERFSLFQRMVLGSVLLAGGAVGFAFAQGWVAFILAMFAFTLGEIVLVPAEYAQVDQITPPGMRGTYYGTGGSRAGQLFGAVVGRHPAGIVWR